MFDRHSNRSASWIFGVVGVAFVGVVMCLRSPVPSAGPDGVREGRSGGKLEIERTAAQEAVSGPARAETSRRSGGAKVVWGADEEAWLEREERPEFSRFAAWAADYFREEDRGVRSAMVEEGRILAEQRRERLKALISADPARAIGMTVPDRLRKGLPDPIRELLEERVDGRGDLEVVCAMGGEVGRDRILRTARLGARRWQARVYGRRMDDGTRRSVALHGIALDAVLALEETPYRMLGQAEAREWLETLETRPVCEVGREPVGSDGHFLNVGGVTHAVCSGGHLEAYAGSLLAVEGGGGGGFGGGAAAEGMKALILLRVDFSDLPGEPISEERGAEMIGELNAFYQESSYGRAGFLAVGAGSVVTRVFRMPETAAYYGSGDRYWELRSDAMAVALATGLVLSDYDYDVICMGAVPGFPWGGLGNVGSAGAWLRQTGDSGVAAHELGHNLGLNHANAWETGGESVIGGAGVSVEYGDEFDTMGLATAGPRHFNARYKELLGWIRPEEMVTVTSSGRYRIYAQDDPGAQGIRALQIARDSLRSYWVEFRQQFAGNRWMMNGAGLRWGGDGNQRSNLLDTTPGSSGGFEDSALVIGRTFSDSAAGIHVTPVAKGGTTPESLEVVIELGAFRTNLPPQISIASEVTATSPGMPIVFHGLASDGNGDELAYYWDFGDGTFGTNGVVVRHAWELSGEYVVRCEVTDMRGGRGSDSVVMRVGTPSTYRVSGRVFADGVPLEGVRVFASSTLMTRTDSDGAYTLVGLDAGEYTLGASLEGYQFSPATFFNPVKVGPDAFGVDFVGGDPASRNRVQLIPGGAVWRYYDGGANLGEAWRSVEYDDRSWPSGQAEFGYGEGDESTVLYYGPDAQSKQVTTYFRKFFLVENPDDFSSLEMEVLRDDGAVVYLNGTEVWRNLMPEGALAYDTLAAETVGGVEEGVFVGQTLTPSLLVSGTNLLAVEVHQASPSSSDVSFNLRLTGLIASNALVTAKSTWRYLDNGSSQLTEWLSAEYDDSDWGVGVAQFGYGDLDEATVISFGPNPSNKHITTYFRHLFTVNPETRIGNMNLGLMRDDGAVVYLNGREVFRSNMPDGPVNAAVLAASAVGGGAESMYHETTVDPLLLVQGTNVLAVEVHQHSSTSSDVSFDAYLVAFGTLNSARNVYIKSPANTAEIELPTDLVVLIEADAGYGRNVSRVELLSGDVLLGVAEKRPYSLVWSNPPPGTHVLTARAIDDAGETLTSLPVTVVLSYPVVEAELIGLGGEWRYLDDGSDQGTDWSEPGYDDGDWAVGRGRFGYGGDDEVTVVSFGPDEENKYLTTYFRREFEVASSFELTELRFRLQRDDGAVVYLNGREIFRSNILPGEVFYDTRAYAAAGGSDEYKLFEFAIPAEGWVVEGRNLVAVEVHQATPSSSDLGFDLWLTGFGRGDVEVPVLRLERDGARVRLSWPLASFGWTLYGGTDLVSCADWTPVSSPVVSTNGENLVLLVPSRQQQFFRLMRPY